MRAPARNKMAMKCSESVLKRVPCDHDVTLGCLPHSCISFS